MSETIEHTTALPVPKRRRWLTWLLMGVVFIAGGAVGSAATIHWLIDRFQGYAEHPERAPKRITERMREKLDLTDDQAEKVQDILHRRQQELMAIRREVHPRVQAIMDASREEVGAVLTEEQQAKWEKMYRHLERRWMGPNGHGRRRSGEHRSHHRSRDADGPPADAGADVDPDAPDAPGLSETP